MKTRIVSSAIFMIFLCASTASRADIPENYWYLAANAGIFQGHFNTQYNDLTDVIAQNIHEPVYQNGYSGGVAIGYHKSFLNEYFIGGELSASAPTDEASFASGASSTAFSDKLSIAGNIDLSLISGFALTDSTSVYARIGLSYAAISTEINTPTGFTPSYVNSSSSRNKFGGGFGLGFKKFVTTNTALFTEYQYHDYGTVNFPNFQNFTATYSHSARVYTQNLIIGLAYAL